MLSIGLWLIWIPCGSESVFFRLAPWVFLACGVGFFVVVFSDWVLWGVGLSLKSRWSISVAPVRGGTYFLCMPQRK
jgi:hypothetical protein